MQIVLPEPMAGLTGVFRRFSGLTVKIRTVTGLDCSLQKGWRSRYVAVLCKAKGKV
jgi:hypothetical protein